MVETVAPVSISAVQVMSLKARVISFSVPTNCSLLMGLPCAEPDPWPQDLACCSLKIYDDQCGPDIQSLCVLLDHTCSKQCPSYQGSFAAVAYHQYSLGKQTWN